MRKDTNLQLRRTLNCCTRLVVELLQRPERFCFQLFVPSHCRNALGAPQCPEWPSMRTATGYRTLVLVFLTPSGPGEKALQQPTVTCKAHLLCGSTFQSKSPSTCGYASAYSSYYKGAELRWRKAVSNHGSKPRKNEPVTNTYLLRKSAGRRQAEPLVQLRRSLELRCAFENRRKRLQIHRGLKQTQTPRIQMASCLRPRRPVSHPARGAGESQLSDSH